jgi:uncharacterized Zn finger protein
MSRYYGGWAPYVSVAERRRQAEREVARLRKSGHPLAPVTLSGRLIATTFWGRAWCDNMESYRDYESRLPRGRTYVRNGSVVDLQIEPGRVTAMVRGSELYHVAITIKETAKTQWQAICTDCAGGIDSLVELLQGRLSEGVMDRLCRQENGLFPGPSDIRFSCSCPDHASMCKHVAAVLYGVGARLDHAPELLFRLRVVDETDLLAGIDTALPLSKTGPVAGKVLQADDMSALFGLEMAADEEPATRRPSDRSAARCSPSAPEGTASLSRTDAPQEASVKLSPRTPASKRKVPATKRVPLKPVALAPSIAKATPGGLAAPKQAVTTKASSRLAPLEKAVTIEKLKGPRHEPAKMRERTDAHRRPKATSSAAHKALEMPPRGRTGLLASKDKPTTVQKRKQKPVK